MQIVTQRNKSNLWAVVIGVAAIVSAYVPIGLFMDWTMASVLVIPPTVGGLLLYIALRLIHNRKGASYYGAPLIVGSIILFAYTGVGLLLAIRLAQAPLTGGVD